RFQPNLFLGRISVDDSPGSSGEEDVAGLERPVLRRVADDLLAIEDHVAGVRGLSHFAVDPALQLEVVRIGNLIRGDEVRPNRTEAVAGFSQHQLGGLGLQVAGGEIVSHAVAKNVGKGVRLAHVAGDLAHHDHQLDLVVELLGDLGQVDHSL